MTHARAYRQQQDAGWTRIDTLLALYDGAIERLQMALAALRRGDGEAAGPPLARAHLLLLQMAAGINLDAGAPSSPGVLRLVEFCMHAAASREPDKLEAAVTCLETVREGFLAIRPEAVQLERTGVIPPLRASQVVEQYG